MANHKSAAKRARQAVKRQKRNNSVKSKVKTFEKKVLKALGEKNKEAAHKALVTFMSQIDRAARKGAVHANRASRRISRLSKQIASLG